MPAHADIHPAGKVLWLVINITGWFITLLIVKRFVFQSPQLVKKKEEQPLTVNQFQFNGWNKNASTPASRGSLMTLLEMVERSQIKTGNHAVVIHCM